MQNWITASLVLLSAVGYGNEQISYKNAFSPKLFYRNHTETNYSYKTFGMGLEYYLFKEEGINVKIKGITNAKSSNALIEFEDSIFYRIPLGDCFNFFPVLSHKNSFHLVEKTDSESYFINKSVLLGGLGFELMSDETFRVYGIAEPFRDISNTLLIVENEFFSGKKFSNPFGIRGKIGFLAEISDHFLMDVEAYYSKTFKNCYEEFGSELSIKWRF